MILTHPYEGGHPDHDATAFAVHAACRLLRHEGTTPPALVEMTSYHLRAGALTTYEFLPNGEGPVITVRLGMEERFLKRRMVECHATQQQVLDHFPIDIERFRPAPRYDFARPPHPGRLYYEQFDWGLTGARWRALAADALAALRLVGPI